MNMDNSKLSMEQIEIMKDFGKCIKRLRKEHHFTQEQLAVRADISNRNLSDLENGKVNCHLTTLYLLAKAFDITLSELFILLEMR